VAAAGQRHLPRVLTIAGSDSGGGAGIEADLKAFAACGVHGMAAVTAITAQNTVAVTAVHPVPGEVVVAQVAAVVEDIGVDAVKIGMLGTVATIEAVERALRLLGDGVPVVLDPVMVAESGGILLEPDAREALIELLLPRVTVVTPNLAEARVLAGGGTADEDQAEVQRLAKAIRRLGPEIVIVTGGHRDRASDLFLDARGAVEISGPRHPDGAAHGSGCTHSSVLAARLAWGEGPLEAARAARAMAAAAVGRGLREIGAGAGPVDILDLRSREPTGRGSPSGGEPDA
jgi:hydroxymethylpyrimidine/phosphomethylpyrimidine kinase